MASLTLRHGRAIGWTLVWLVDVAGLSRPDALKTMRWSAKTLLRGAL